MQEERIRLTQTNDKLMPLKLAIATAIMFSVGFMAGNVLRYIL